MEILRKNYALLPQPQGDLALATAFAAAGDAVSAAIYNQRVYYGFPASAEAASAEAQLTALRTQLGDNYPPSLPNAMLSRALKLLDGGQTQRAKKELEALVPQLGGTDRDLARVSIGVADYNAKETDAARRYLASLETSSADADAERLYYLLLSARQLKNEDEVNACLDSLARLYPNSTVAASGTGCHRESLPGPESDGRVRTTVPDLLRDLSQGRAGGGVPLEGGVGPLSET